MQKGDVLADRFLVERLAGSGGMGKVYRGRDLTADAPVAIKVLLANHSESDRLRFARETWLLSAIDHPGVVRYVAQGHLSTREPFLVMEWLDGEDLYTRLERGPLEPAEAVVLAARLGEALGALHESGIVHRDFKPGNVLLVGGAVETPKLLDFGIASSDVATRLTSTGMLIGTASYMAPEQVRGESVLDARADVFSLGCVMFECLTGERAFDGGHAVAILAKILLSDAPRLQEKRPELPPALCRLVDRMLSKSPDERPANGIAVTDALRQLSISERSPIAEADTISSRVTDLPRTALTPKERRAAAVILIEAATSKDRSNDSLFSTEAAKFGGRYQRLIDGSAVVLVSGPRVATDLAAKAAQCAIALKRLTRGHAVSIAIGLIDETWGTLSSVIDRAASVLGTKFEAATAEYVLLDAKDVGLLDTRFDVFEHDGVHVIRAQREIAELRTLLGKPTPCVGRDRELRQIVSLFEECVGDKEPRAILVTAPAGVGKSRIGREMILRLRGRSDPPSIWIARGEILAAGSPLGMLAGLVRSACGIQAGESVETRRTKLRARVGMHVPAADQRRIMEFLGEIVDAQFEDDESLPLFAARRDAQLMSAQVQAAFVEFLAAECNATPVVILLEDLHWGDRATVRILDIALRDLAQCPCFMLALARPELYQTFPKLRATGGLEQLHLQQLGRKASEQLVRHVLGERASLAVVNRIVRLADGNAFHLEELIRATAEGSIENLPATAVAMVEWRISGLPEMQRRLLRAASIFGETFWIGGIDVLVGSTVSTRESIQALEDGELITKRRESRFVGNDEYAFRHALLREGAYAMLTEHDRAVGHRLAGQWLEEKGETDPLVLAQHFQTAGDGATAAQHLSRAAEMSCRSGDSAAAMHHAQRGLDVGAVGNVRDHLLGLVCESTVWTMKDPNNALPNVAELLRNAPAGSVPWMQAIFLRSAVASFAGNVDDLLQTGMDILSVTPSVGTGGTLVLCLGGVVYDLDLQGMVRQVNRLLERLPALLARLPANDPVARALLEAAIRGTRDGYALEDPWGALQHGRTAQNLAKSMGHARLDAMAQIVQGLSLTLLGASDDAEKMLRNVPVADHDIGNGASIRSFLLAWLLADRGDLVEARHYAEGLVALGRMWNMGHAEGRGHWVLAEVLRRIGAVEDAVREADIALDMAAPLDEPGILATIAAVHLSQGNHVLASNTAADGLAKYDQMGACGLFRTAFLRVVHVECLVAMGRKDEALNAAQKARAWLQSVADRIEDLAWRDRFLHCVPENRRLLELGELAVVPSGSHA